MKYEAADLIDHTFTSVEITCSNCRKSDTVHNIDDFDAAEHWFKEGWRATKSNCYCPSCSSKKLKQ